MEQSVLVTGLLVLVGILSILLITRIFRERRQMAAVRKLSLESFSGLLKSSSIEGTIVTVARKVSDLLIESFGCDQIVFLRKKRAQMELNYYHGIRGFNRNDFRTPFSAELGRVLRADFMPRKIKVLKEVVSERLYQRLQHCRTNLFFPILWRDNLYGIYFIRSTIHTDSPAFRLLTASLAQVLSAAYHVKWHESRQDSLQKQVEDISDSLKKQLERDNGMFGLIKLVRHHDSQTIVAQVMSKISEATGISEMVYVYEPEIDSSQPMLLTKGLKHSVDVPDRKTFDQIVRVIEKRRRAPASVTTRDDNLAAVWISDLQRTGLKHSASFPLDSKRRGVLAWSSELPADAVESKLKSLHTHASSLVENAESFARIEELSFTDSLTGLANQRYFFKRLEEEISRANRYRRHVALIFFDLDELKQINDSYGHLAGDTVLKQLGAILRNSIRAVDVIARYGGDEFCVVMPETDENTCEIFMRRLQSEIADAEFVVDGLELPLKCTVSLGGAVFPQHGEETRHLVFAADMALLRAKETGRNRSLIYAADI